MPVDKSGLSASKWMHLICLLLGWRRACAIKDKDQTERSTEGIIDLCCLGVWHVSIHLSMLSYALIHTYIHIYIHTHSIWSVMLTFCPAHYFIISFFNLIGIRAKPGASSFWGLPLHLTIQLIAWQKQPAAKPLMQMVSSICRHMFKIMCHFDWPSVNWTCQPS
jgi:hypothetical protein